MKLLPHLKPCAVAVALAACVAAANAATLEYDVLTPLTPTPFSLSTTLGRFDPTLGTLTGVQISWSSKRTSTGILNYNPAAGAGSVSWSQVGASAQVTTPGILSLVNNMDAESFAWPAGEGCGERACSTVIDRSSTVSSNVLVGSANWSSYTGTGTFDVKLDALPILSDPTFTGSGFVNASWVTTADFLVKVIYDYREAPGKVPEPGVLALLALAAGAFGVARRRKA